MVFKKPAPQVSNIFSVPQTTGKSGWLVFTYDNNIPVCMWITSQECYSVPCCVDERICNDTFLRVERQKNNVYVVSDIWMYNSNCVFACSTFKQRYEWLKDWLPKFIHSFPGSIQLIHKSEWRGTTTRGRELYTEDLGGYGYFVDTPGECVTIVKMSIPDCYEIKPNRGYLRVPDLKTSQYLRKKGDTFSQICIDNEDGSWSLVF